jgi:hypothetical protein
MTARDSAENHELRVVSPSADPVRRKGWEKPHIISFTPAHHSEGVGTSAGDGFTNQS